MKNPDMFAIGSPQWPGLSKLAEEAGETLQIVGKLMGTGGVTAHWDGKGDLKERLAEELADLTAAIEFVRAANDIDRAKFTKRVSDKYHLFCQWHAAPGNPAPAEPETPSQTAASGCGQS